MAIMLLETQKFDNNQITIREKKLFGGKCRGFQRLSKDMRCMVKLLLALPAAQGDVDSGDSRNGFAFFQIPNNMPTS